MFVNQKVKNAITNHKKTFALMFSLSIFKNYLYSFTLRKMISRDDLIKQISNTIGKAKVLKLSRILKEEQFALRDLIDITFSSQ